MTAFKERKLCSRRYCDKEIEEGKVWKVMRRDIYFCSTDCAIDFILEPRVYFPEEMLILRSHDVCYNLKTGKDL